MDQCRKYFEVNQNENNMLAMVAHIYNPCTQEAKKKYHKFDVSPGCIERPCLNSLNLSKTCRTCQNLWDAIKAVLREKFKSVNV
jgi:hypothetical protein